MGAIVLNILVGGGGGGGIIRGMTIDGFDLRLLSLALLNFRLLLVEYRKRE